MAEGSNSSNSNDTKMREIQSSISEGRMMLQILRSLPSSQYNDAFIVRFEELVSKLEQYQQRNAKDGESEEDINSQLQCLREKQDRIQTLLGQTASDFQNSISSTAANTSITEQKQPIQQTLPNSSLTIIPDNNPSNPVDGLLTDRSDLQSNSDVVLESNPRDAKKSHILTSLSRGTLSVSEASRESDNNEKNLNSAPETDQRTIWQIRFQIQVSQLDDLIEESERFSGMVNCLESITKKAQLKESTSLLADISKRFSELRRSFNSLKESYNTIRNEPEVSEELRNVQLSSFGDFLGSLRHNLDSTKECFFTIHHLVKATIEQSVADGTLQEVDESDEDQQPSENSHANHVVSATGDEKLDQDSQSDFIQQTNQSDIPIDADDELTSQKAYLVVLQQRTAQEREEVAKLLQQRNELAERLASLKAAANRIPHTNSYDSQTESQKSIKCVIEETESPVLNSVSSSLKLSSPLLTHLEAKKKELEELKSQLAILRKAEAKIASLTPNFPTSDSALPESTSTQNIQISTRASQSVSKCNGRNHESHLPLSGNNASKTRFTGYVDQPHTCLDGDDIYSETETNTSDLPLLPCLSNKGDSVTFQQPEATCIDNTERLYVNMREARIRREEQLNHTVSDASAPNGFRFGNPKSSQNVGCGGASVATSQDRTTLATWGGSSPVPSCSSDSSRATVDEDANSGPGSEPINNQSVLVVENELSARCPVMNSRCAITVDSPALRSQEMKPTKTRQRSSRRRGPLHSSVTNQNGFVNSEELVCKLSLPQVGRSPSPPSHIKSQSTGSQTHDSINGVIDRQVCIDGDQLPVPSNIYTRRDIEVSNRLPVHANINDCDDGRLSELSSFMTSERVQRLETNVAQLYQICRCLMLENSQLNTTVTQMMLHGSTSQQFTHTLQRPQTSGMANTASLFPQQISNSAYPVFNSPSPNELSTTYQTLLQRQNLSALGFNPSSLNFSRPASVFSAADPELEPNYLSQSSGSTENRRIQVLLNQMLQQQATFAQLQSELQRLLRIQQDPRQPAPNANLGVSLVPSLNNHAHFNIHGNGAHNVEASSGPTSLLESGMRPNQSSAPAISTQSFTLPQTAPWSGLPVGGLSYSLYPCDRTSVSMNSHTVDPRPILQPTTSLSPVVSIPLDQYVSITSPHLSSLGLNNLPPFCAEAIAVSNSNSGANTLNQALANYGINLTGHPPL